MKCPTCGRDNVAEARFCAGCGSALSNAAGYSGEKLGPYELRGELGHGAMAIVWLAWDSALEREVAIKELKVNPSLSNAVRAEMARRFVQEAKTVAKLEHPNIVTIYSADEYDGRFVIVMEREGSTLSDILERGALDPRLALSILDQLLDAVGYAHGRGVVHRDIKPDNIFVDSQGRVKLSDFGIAHAADAEKHPTMEGSVLGTPGYMSPEQACGHAVDARSDLFSVGVVAHEMLTGKNPFGAGRGTDAASLLYRIVHEPAPALPPHATEGLPVDLRPAIMMALEKDPNRRPQSAAAFKAQLHGGVPASGSYGPNGGVVPVDPSSGSKLPQWLPYAIVGIACVIAIALALVIANASPQSSPNLLSNNRDAENQAVIDPHGTTTAMYYLGDSGGYVAIFSNSSAEPVEVSDIDVDDLVEDDAAEVDSHVEFGSINEAFERLDDYRDHVEEAEAAARKAEEDERKAREEAEEAAAAAAEQDLEQKAESMIASLDGWWHAEFQNNIFAFIDDGAFYIYRPDITDGRHYRTVTTADLVRYENGLPGYFAGQPGFLIRRVADGDKNYYITDADFDDDGRIDMIAHINDDGSGYEEDQTFYRSDPPDYAQ